MVTFVQNEVRFNTVNLGTHYELIVVKIWTGKHELTIINYYNPCNCLFIYILNTIGEQAQGKVKWCGDFNAHCALGEIEQI